MRRGLVPALLAAVACAPLLADSTAAPTPRAEAPVAGSGAAAEHRVTVEVTPASVTIGDRIDATITLEAGAAITGPPRFPVWESHWGDAEILSAGAPAAAGEGRWTQRLVLAVFETGIATLPAVTVEVPQAEETATVSSAPATVEVASILPQGESEEVAPLPPESVRSLPAGGAFWWTASLLALACAALGLLLWRAASRVRDALAALARTPREAFELALERLRGETGVERVYTGLSLELRRYLGRALGFPAAEGTTTEIQRALRERNLPSDLVRETLALLREADQIKFARGAADRQRVGRRLDDAERLVAGVESWLEPAEQQDEAAA